MILKHVTDALSILGITVLNIEVAIGNEDIDNAIAGLLTNAWSGTR